MGWWIKFTSVVHAFTIAPWAIRRRSPGRLDFDDSSQVNTEYLTTGVYFRDSSSTMALRPSPRLPRWRNVIAFEVLIFFTVLQFVDRADISYPELGRPVTRSVTLPLPGRLIIHPGLQSVKRYCTLCYAKPHNGSPDKLKVPLGGASSPKSPPFGFLESYEMMESNDNLPRCHRTIERTSGEGMRGPRP